MDMQPTGVHRFCGWCGWGFWAKTWNEHSFCPDCRTDNKGLEIRDPFFPNVVFTPTDWSWVGHHEQKGYATLFRNAIEVRAHRYSYEIHYGPIPKGLGVLHHCDIRDCTRPECLWVGTNGDNNTDRSMKGRSALGERSGRYTHPEKTPRGANHGNAKLDDDKVRAIRVYLKQGMEQRDIAAIFGISQTAVWMIRSGRYWKHVV